MKITGTSCLLLLAYTCCIGIAASRTLRSKEHLKHHLTKREVQCEDSKFLVSAEKNATFVKIVTDNGDVLFNVDSTHTTLNDLDNIMNQLQLLFFPEPGYYLYGNSSDYYIVKTPIENGLKLRIEDKYNERAFEKEVIGSNEGLKKADVKCAHITGFKFSREPTLDANHRDGFNMSLLSWACLLGEEEAARGLIESGADTNSPGDAGYTPLVGAIVSGKDGLVEYLVKKGARVDEEVGKGKARALHIAAVKGRLRAAQILIDSGANVSSRVPDVGATPLHNAINEFQNGVAKLLVDRGADLNARLKDGLTPLHSAVKVGNEELIHYLIQKGADINSRDNENSTPLILAVLSQNTDGRALRIVKHLLENHNPDINLKCNHGKTALAIAAEKQYKEIQDYLKAHGAL